MNKKQPTIKLTGKCGKYDFELSVRAVPFPSDKERDRAYRVWAETFADVYKKGGKV